jgi:Asp-tRNA(Asn)/Glu-tRNA(Gln) amidotransferase C subunit
MLPLSEEWTGAPKKLPLASTADAPLRDDVPAELLSPELAVANAPAARGTAFTVPRVLDDEAEG